MDRVRARLNYYGKNTNLHGIKYVVDENKNPIIRFLWIAMLSFSLFCMYYFISTSYNAYRSNAISFVTETTYLDWETNFPAVTVCETSTQEITWTSQLSEAYSHFVSDMIFFTGNCYNCSSDCQDCAKADLKDLVKRYRKRCDEILGKCRWRDTEFDCCEMFMPFENEYGICYSINSMHTKLPSWSNVSLTSNRDTGPGELMMQTLEDVRMYIHAPEDVPYINSDPDKNKDILTGASTNLTLDITEIENDENVKTLPIESRGCRFPWENDGIVVHQHYSYSSCIVQCRAEAHYRLCNCTHHLMPVLGEEKYCDIEGLRCLSKNFETLNRLHARGYDKIGLLCECLPSCVEPEYKIVLEQKGSGPAKSETIIRMQTLPTSRFKRIVVRTTLDLVVQIGSAIGLFIGGSLLSIIEIVYLMFMRRFK